MRRRLSVVAVAAGFLFVFNAAATPSTRPNGVFGEIYSRSISANGGSNDFIPIHPTLAVSTAIVPTAVPGDVFCATLATIVNSNATQAPKGDLQLVLTQFGGVSNSTVYRFITKND